MHEKQKAQFVCRLAIVVLAFATAGCSAINVNRGADADASPDGVPFYTKRAVCQQETVYLEPIYKLTLTATPTEGGKPKEIEVIPKEIQGMEKVCVDKEGKEVRVPCYIKGTKVFYLEKEKEIEDDYQIRDGLQRADIQTLFRTILDKKSTWEDIAEAFRAVPSYVGKSLDDAKSILVLNENKMSVYIDYEHPYFYNVKIPLVGSANTDITLTSDLTLSKVTANITEQTLKTFLDLLPVKEVITGALKAATKGGDVNFQLTIEPQAYKYTFSKQSKNLPCAPIAPIPLTDNSAFTARTKMTGEESKKKENADNAITFSGNIGLPKQPQQPK